MNEVPQRDETSSRSSQPDPDLLLLRAVANGSRHALSELYARHGRSILSYLVGQLSDRQLAEEVLQDVMVAAWQGAAGFRGESKVKTWLLAIARRKVLNEYRKRKLALVELDEEIGLPSQQEHRLTAHMEKLEDREAVREILYQLPDEQRETLELIFYHNLSGVEAAEVLGVSDGTIKSRLYRAKEKMRGLLLRKEVQDEQRRP